MFKWLTNLIMPKRKDEDHIAKPPTFNWAHLFEADLAEAGLSVEDLMKRDCAVCGKPVDEADISYDIRNLTVRVVFRCHGTKETHVLPKGLNAKMSDVPSRAFLSTKGIWGP